MLSHENKKSQWCLSPRNVGEVTGDIFLPDQGEVEIGRAILGINDRKISRRHLSVRIQENELTIKLLHHNPCHFKKRDNRLFQNIPNDGYVKLDVGDHIILMCTYEYEVAFKDQQSAAPPRFRPRSCTARTEILTRPLTQYVNYEQLKNGATNEEEEVDDGLPPGDLGSHMSWRDPDKEVPGPDRYHQDWLILNITEELKGVKAQEAIIDDTSMFSNHSEERPSIVPNRYPIPYNQIDSERPTGWKAFSLCGKAPAKAD